jgi:3',5'-cyclic AMP phosphodiesterase CpdA
MNRRSLINAVSLLAAGAFAGLPKWSPAMPIANATATRTRQLRIAHITDIHLVNMLGAPKKFERCLHHIQSLEDKPDIIFNGGDAIMDALEKSKSRVQRQWDLWHSVLNNECGIPVEHCIGNHDVWGLDKAKSDPLYGKGYALEMMKISSRYKAFDRNGWRFIILDSTQPREDESWYIAKLDEEQEDWLRDQLYRTPASNPVLIMSHIPILAACVFFDGDNLKNGNWQVPGSWMHADSANLVRLFNKYPNVKACISGHIHLLDHVEYNNVHYFCNGAVCGAWWMGAYKQTQAGYALLDLYNDGTVERSYVSYND